MKNNRHLRPGAPPFFLRSPAQSAGGERPRSASLRSASLGRPPRAEPSGAPTFFSGLSAMKDFLSSRGFRCHTPVAGQVRGGEGARRGVRAALRCECASEKVYEHEARGVHKRVYLISYCTVLRFKDTGRSRETRTRQMNEPHEPPQISKPTPPTLPVLPYSTLVQCNSYPKL